MPEYLTPGVYVEETSFRSKSIEGVSTSTTAFVGSTRRGPLTGTPELLTSYSEFERVFGSFGALDFAPDQPNYLANSVRAYFDNGGARLYVARVYQASAGNHADDTPLSHARSVGGGGADRMLFRGRFPGSGCRCSIALSILPQPVGKKALPTAPDGSLLRLGEQASRPAVLEGGQLPLRVRPDTGLSLRVTVEGAAPIDIGIQFRGSAATLTAGDDLNPILAAAARLEVALDGGPVQVLELPAGDNGSVENVALALNRQLRQGSVELDGAKLVISSDRRGSSSKVEVKASPSLGFAANGVAEAANSNVPDLDVIESSDIARLLQAAGPDLRAVERHDVNGRRWLQLQTRASGDTARLEILPLNGSAHPELGLSVGVPVLGVGTSPRYYLKSAGAWRDANGVELDLDQLQVSGPQAARLLLLNVTVTDPDGLITVHEELGFDSHHPRAIHAVLAQTPSRKGEQLRNPVWFDAGPAVTAFGLLEAWSGSGDTFIVSMGGGNDGESPVSQDYVPALERLRAIEGISIIAAPGYSALASETARDGVRNELISFAERRRSYQIAVLDTARGLSPGEAGVERSEIDSRYAAVYYPWVVVPNPLARPGDLSQREEIELPPSGFLCGIYARNDVQRGVFKAPANEVVRGALRLEQDINFDQQAVLNPAGVNCLRFFPGRGYRVWGARLASSDPEWKYVSDRRYFNFLGASIDRGTQWVVFEPNGDRLWKNVRETVTSFLHNEWKNGYLLGDTPEKAFFVRCDLSTMTQNDLDNGRLVCMVGVAIIRPAEFVIFRIGQKTADARS